jgi:uncharacterized SAM-binding protein YcdF (DUF218 family)
LIRLAVRLLGRPLEARDAEQRADAIVVLGTMLMPDGSLSRAGEELVRAGAALFARELAPWILFTGGRAPGVLHAHEVTEADAMARAARALGVPERAILLETESRSTRENARRSAGLLRARGLTRVWIVTQPFHLRRAARHFRRAGLEPLAWRIDDGLQERDPGWALRRVLMEYVSWGKSLLRG